MRLKGCRWGFTLIEFLLALSIFAVVAAAIYSTFSGGIRLSRSSQVQNKIYREARWSFEEMSKDLENAIPYDFSGSYPDKRALWGEHRKISFILPTGQGLKVVSYYLEKPEEGSILKTIVGKRHSRNMAVTTQSQSNSRVYYLVKEEMDFVDYLSGGLKAKSNIEILSTNVKEDGLTFSYGYLQDEQQKNIDWVGEWPESYIPAAVRVNIDFIPDGENTGAMSFRRDIFIPTGQLNTKQINAGR